MEKTVLKQLIELADNLDCLRRPHLANAVDKLIKYAQAAVNDKDLAHAIQFYNDTSLDEVTPENLSLTSISYMPPEEFIPGTDASDKGWLKDFPKEKWPELLTEKHGRNFTHIVRMYLAGQMSPAIQIDGSFADGMARSIFYNAIGEDMPVANFVTQKQETELP